MNEQAISHVPLFSTLPQSEIGYLAETLRPCEALPGAVLMREGEFGDRFYVVLDGQLEIVKALGTADERLVGVRGPGEYIGEMSLLNRDGLRTASVRARTPAQLLEMTRADFDALLSRQPALAYNMVRVLSMRLSEAHTHTIEDLREKNRQLTEAYESLKAAQAQLIEKEKLEHELHVALQVQASLLPRETPQLPGWEFAVRWQPAREVSGDFYDLIPLAAEAGPDGAPAWGLVIADVSDKGMPAALFMAVTRSIVRASVTGAKAPAECITQANRLVCLDAGQGMFVTFFYAQLNPANGDLTYVNAGHNPPWVYRAEDESWIELTRTGLPLGIFAQTLGQRSVRLNSGDWLFLYTDGLIDAANPQQQDFGSERMQRVLHQHRHAPVAVTAAALDQALSDFREGRELYDDITFMLVKRN